MLHYYQPMIKFFRQIRQTLIMENKTSKYLKYAIGEIVLVVIGILIALQVNNTNEKRNNETHFKANLELLYTTIKFDVEMLNTHSINFNEQSVLIDTLLYYPDFFEDQDLPYALFKLTFNNYYFTSESIYHSQQLIYDPNNITQKEITKEIVNYNSAITNLKYRFDDRLEKALHNIDIASPMLIQSGIIANWSKSDSTYYTSNDLKNLHNLVRSHSFRAILKSVKSDKIWNFKYARNRYNDGISIRNLIKSYYPDVKEIYNDVGIIGTSINGFDEVGARSTPMTLTDIKQSIWEIDLYLKEGRVKFRCRDSWLINWGGTTFPKGKADFEGPDIQVTEAGNYHIIINLTANTYEFIKKDD